MKNLLFTIQFEEDTFFNLPALVFVMISTRNSGEPKLNLIPQLDRTYTFELKN